MKEWRAAENFRMEGKMGIMEACQDKNCIPIAYATDQNYLFYTCVSITSLAENANKGTYYKIYILVGESFIDEADLIGKLEKRYHNIEIEIIVVDSSVFAKVFINSEHISKAAFYRLALCNCLDVDKCIYLDSDTIVTEDLLQLFDYNIEAYYVAGCRDIWIDMLSAEEREKRRIQTRIPDMDEYINSGILLFNLKKIREDNLNNTFIEHLKYNYRYEDQDILNVCCYHKILRLPTKWNRFTAAIEFDKELAEAGVAEDIIQEFKEQNGIIHYINKNCRPWEGFLSWESWRWWQFAQKWSDEAVFKKVYGYVEAKERQNSWKECLKKCNSVRFVVIWGYTKYAEDLCDLLLNASLDAQICFCDSNEMKQGERYKGIEVKSPEQILAKKEDSYFLIASRSKREEIKDILLGEGISAENVQIYNQKGLSFYRLLDSRYYEQELEEVFLKEGRIIPSEQRKKELLHRSDFAEKYYLKRWILKDEEL